MSLQKSQQSLGLEKAGSPEGGGYEPLPTQGENLLLQENRSPAQSPNAARSLDNIDDPSKNPKNGGAGTNASTELNQYA